MVQEQIAMINVARMERHARVAVLVPQVHAIGMEEAIPTGFAFSISKSMLGAGRVPNILMVVAPQNNY